MKAGVKVSCGSGKWVVDSWRGPQHHTQWPEGRRDAASVLAAQLVWTGIPPTPGSRSSHEGWAADMALVMLARAMRTRKSVTYEKELEVGQADCEPVE